MENKHIVLGNRDFSNRDFISHVIERFEDYLSGLGYVDPTHEVLQAQYVTNRGKLYAKGEFKGPSPYAKESRSVEDVSTYSYFVLEDLDFEGNFTIEAKHGSATIAVFKIKPNGVYLIDGQLPAVREE